MRTVMSRLLLLTCSFSPDYAQRGNSMSDCKASDSRTNRLPSFGFDNFSCAPSFCLRTMSGNDDPEIPPPQPTQSGSWVLHGGRWRAFPMRRLHPTQALSHGKPVSTE